MRKHHSSSASRLHNLSTILCQSLARGWQRRALCFVLICSMLTWPDEGYAIIHAADLAIQVAKDTFTPVSMPIKWFNSLFQRSPKPLRQETTADRNARVTTISITPARIVAYTGQPLRFSAIGSNTDGLTIQGAQFIWSSSDAKKLPVDSSGMATPTGPGLVWVTASTPKASSHVPVLIKPGTRPVQTDDEWQADQSQFRHDDASITALGNVGTMLNTAFEKLTPTAHAQANGGDSGDFLYDELWSEPRNLVGSPRNHATTSSAIGTILPEGSNFEFSVPLYDLSGRSLSTGLALNYNSRIWSKHGSAVTFNAVNSWPYLGFTLSFGRIVTYGPTSNTKFVLIDSDGTRHYLGSGAFWTTNTYQTNDGSHITYIGDGNSGTLYYNNGIKKGLILTNNRLLVVTVTDANGNYIGITYKSLPQTPSCVGHQGYQAIDYIMDTLGRVIQFNYDSCNLLTSIDVPGYEGTAQNPVTTTIARFDYTTPVVSSSFSGLTVENVPTGFTSGQVTELSHVYFPATQNGYKFSYSAYGMITTVSRRTGMSYNSGTGAIGDGTEKAYVSFNYPATASSLTDAPSFSQWTQYPAATSGGTATYSFTATSGTGTKVFTITNPDSSTVTLTRSDSSGTTAYGLLTQSELKTSGGTSMAKSVISYTTDGGGQPQVANVITYDDATPTANQMKMDFDYDGYGNLTNLREYGFQQSGSWVVRRRTRNVYKTDTSYVNAYLRSLIIERDVYDAQMDTNDANDVLVAKTTSTYDDYNAMGGMENYGGTSYSIGHVPNYDTTVTVRGNVTGVTQYTDVNAPTSITHLRKIDIFGNVVKEELSCCNQQVMNTNEANGYVMPVTIVKGNPSGVMLTTTYGSDFNTSLQKSVTDANSQTTNIASRDAALRVTQIDLPAGATRTTSFNDSTLSISQSSIYNDGGTQKTLTETTVTDGWDRVIQTVDANGGQVNTNYDNMGRVTSVTNPFPSGGSPSYSVSYIYDALGRATTFTLPDSQTVQTSYNGNSVTVTDPVNRKVQQVKDGLGRLATVNEQNGTGALTQATTYSYDALGNLTQMNQGNQLRSYKYDALARLLYERIPEQTASINDGSGTLWTTKYTYTDYHAVATRTDARGVITTYSYDSLHRLTQTSYNTVSGVTTAPTVTYTYDSDSTYSTTAAGMLLRVNVGTDYQERYTFDSNYRRASTVRTIGTRSYTTGYGHNDASQMTQLTYPSGLAIAINYDANGRMSGLQNASTLANYLSSVSYNIAGQVTAETFGNGVTEQFGYDAARQQLTSQKAGTTSPYTNRMDLTYNYSAVSNQMGVGSTAGNAGQLVGISGAINATTESATYTYDNYGRLKSSNQTSNGSSANRTFVYDRWSNRTEVWQAGFGGGTQLQGVTLSQSGGVPTNRIASVTSGGSTVNYTYDAAGNVTNDGVYSYTYDSENRLVSIGSGTTATYAYDNQNRRYKKTVSSVTTHYVWENNQVLSEHNGSTGSVQVSYIYSGGRIIATIASSTTSYFLCDRLSIRAILNTSGNVIGRQAHLPFGEDFAESGTQQKQHFTSYERDAESVSDYAVNRQYNQNVGRFMRVDPYWCNKRLKNLQGINRYAYADNDPVNKIDPDGREDLKIPSQDEHLYSCLLDNDCHSMGEKIRDLTKGVGIRWLELDDSDPVKYKGHSEIWTRQKNMLNKCIQKFQDNNCGPPDLPSGFKWEWAENQASAPAPHEEGFEEFVNRGGLIFFVMLGGWAALAAGVFANAAGWFLRIVFALIGEFRRRRPDIGRGRPSGDLGCGGLGCLAWLNTFYGWTVKADLPEIVDE